MVKGVEETEERGLKEREEGARGHYYSCISTAHVGLSVTFSAAGESEDVSESESEFS
jgi:hypothetical protein